MDDEELAAARTASSPNVAFVRDLYDAWLTGDIERALAGVDPELEWVEPRDTPDASTWSGPEGVLESMAKWTEPFEDFGFEVVEAFDVGEQVLVELVQHARGKGSGVAVEGHIWHLWTVREGRAVRLEMFGDRDEALAAADSRRAVSGDA